ncbi:MAG: hypothetical protein K0R57_2365 [Paenibacillaceae bacterium]|nr:hypothetical protein [Paenibacillaceae bacterium]
MIVDAVKANDLTQLAKLYKQLMGSEPDQAAMRELFPVIGENPNYYLLGAYQADRLCGTVMGIVCYDLVGLCKPFMVVENVVVDEECRGMGTGAALMHDIERIARKRECTYIMLVSGMKRRQAHKFYEAMGYRLDRVQGFKKELDNYPGQTVGAGM